MVGKVILPLSKRPDSTKVLFLVTDGPPNAARLARKTADYLKRRANVDIYAIAIGENAGKRQLSELASKAENVFPMKSFKDLKKLKRKILSTGGVNEYYLGAIVTLNGRLVENIKQVCTSHEQNLLF